MIILLVFLPLITCQYAPQGLQPDVMFGEHNDRFDVGGMFQDIVGYSDDPEFRRFKLPSRRSGGWWSQPKSRRDDWYDDLGAPGAEDYLYPRARDGPRPNRRDILNEILRSNPIARNKKDVPVIKKEPAVRASGSEREVVMHYALPIKLQLKDTVNGTFITGIKL